MICFEMMSVVDVVFSWPDSRDHSEEQPSLFGHRDDLRAPAQREGEISLVFIFRSEVWPPCSPLSPCCCDLFQMQSFGVFEGRPKDELRNLANACGQSSRDFTPPGGETPNEVNQAKVRKTDRENNSTTQWTL